jgi:hypothetical protein
MRYDSTSETFVHFSTDYDNQLQGTTLRRDCAVDWIESAGWVLRKDRTDPVTHHRRF